MELLPIVKSALENENLKNIKSNFKMTPIFEFWEKIKDEANVKYGLNNIVLFQVGNFYETYFEDAHVYSKTVNETLTSKSKKNEFAAPMSGSPKFSLEKKVDILVKSGFTVIVVSEVSKTEKGSERKITDIHTPGTYFDKTATASNYVAYFDNNAGTASIIDVYTSENMLLDVENENDIRNIIKTYGIVDILSSDGSIGLKYRNLSVNESFLKERGIVLVNEKYNNAIAQCISYCENVKETKIFLKNPDFIGKSSDRFQLGQDALNNLDIINHTGGVRYSLYGFLNKTATPMGSRLLRKNLLQPFKDKSIIESILDDVETEIRSTNSNKTVLTECYDIDRLSSKMLFKGFSPSDLSNLGASLSNVNYVADWIDSSKYSKNKGSGVTLAEKEIDMLCKFKNTVYSFLLDVPSNSPYDGYVFKKGINEDLDKLRSLVENKDEVFKKEFEKIKLLGIDEKIINKMKLSNNKTGIFIEIKKTSITAQESRTLSEKLIYYPPTKNFYRFGTAELENIFEKSIVAEEKRGALESSMFEKLRLDLIKYVTVLKKFAQSVAYMDYTVTLASIAKENSYTKPELSDNVEFTAFGLRHPVVEKIVPKFTKNDVYFKEQKLKVLTGPNMGGKSIYLKSIGIAALLTQIGSFVPAKFLKLGISDNILVRAGSADDFSKNQSTFFLEMSEVAEMLKLSTPNSLLLVDELGRGTDTADGTAISKAVLTKISEIGSLCLFSTHYHSLTEFVKTLKSSGNCHVSVKVSENGKLTFTHEVKEGEPEIGKSYGIEIAEAAGLPIDIINKAKEFKDLFS